MNITWNSCFVVVVVCINYFCCLVNSQPFGYPTANLSTKWTNSPSAPHSVDFNDGSTVRAILLRGALGFGPRYACGFFCNGDCDTYLFAIYIVQTNSGGGITHGGFPQVVWSANRDNPVKLNATLDLTSDGDLILRDVGGNRLLAALRELPCLVELQKITVSWSLTIPPTSPLDQTLKKVLSIVSPPSGRKKKTNWIKTILAISLGSISGLFVLIVKR
ncbi:hypothetical protein QYF36_023012 [Acer negundo]|nr:hypothetical protein QYF36_023012 [Acer negundo]